MWQSFNFLGGQVYWMELWWNFEFYLMQQEILKSCGFVQCVVECMCLWEDEVYVGSVVGEGFGFVEVDQVMIGQFVNCVCGGFEICEVKGIQFVDIVYCVGNLEQVMCIVNVYVEVFIDYGKVE